MTLTLNFFGAFQVFRNDQPVKFATDYARALLAYLAIEGRPYERAALAALLWPGQPEPSARQSLRQTLLYVRQALGDTDQAQPVLVATTKTLQVQLAGVACDVQRFQQLLATCAAHTHGNLPTCPACVERLQAAVDLYQGEFLHGFFVKGSQLFEEWALFLREQLHRQALDACSVLAEHYQAQGDAHRLQLYAAQQLAWEPWREVAHRQLMWALATLGQNGAALAQYTACCRVLAEELGAQPEAETTALYEQIRRGVFGKVTPDKGQSDSVKSDSVKSDGAHIAGATTIHPASPPSPPHNLPEAPTPLIGRAQAVAEIGEQLQRPDVRLLTLVGPGGMGKTRLALAVGRACLGDFADGVWFVPLAALSTPTALASAIATALGLALQGGDPRTLLLQSLREKQLLLILDNFEHLLVEGATPAGVPAQSAVDLVVELLNGAPRVQILVTSRERLKLRSEKLYTVQPLSFAPEATLTAAADASAVRLFAQAVQQQQPNFQLTGENLADVLRICRLVQGMPLGLELAAANTDLLSLPEIADAIAQNADFLAVDWRDLPERQRSMRAVFAWSWGLLDEQERRVFRQLALFQGGFTRAAAETVAGATLPLLTRLLHKSLLHSSAEPANAGRYQIHELVRQFAAAELAASGEQAAVADRHSGYYLTLLADQQRKIMRNALPEGMSAIQSELDNIRQAWRWGAGHLAAALVEQSAVTLREFYLLGSLTIEAIEMFDLAAQARQRYRESQISLVEVGDPRATSFDPAAEAHVYSLLLGIVAAFQLAVGRHEETLQLATAVLQVASAENIDAGLALGYMLQGQALRRQGKSDVARRLLNQSVALVSQARASAPNPLLLLDIEYRAYSWLVSIALSYDDYQTARTQSVYILELCQQFQMLRGEIMALTCLIDIDKALGDYARAQQYTEQALAAAHKANFLWREAICFEHLADIALAQGDYHQAEMAYEQACAGFRTTNCLLDEARAMQMRGRLWLLLGNVNQARTWIEHAFQLLQTLGSPAREIFWATASRARLHYHTGDLPQAFADAEQAVTMARQLDGKGSQAEALVLFGLVCERLHQTDKATAAYQEAITMYAALGHRHQLAEPQAGLARLALAAGALDEALLEIEEVLLILQSHPVAGFDAPFQVYLTCYQVLAAVHDARATPLLITAHELLTTYAARLLDPAVRRSFLENVTSHRELQEMFGRIQAASGPLPQPRNGGQPPMAPGQAAPTQSTTPPNNLPAQPTAFVGRTRELAELTTRLQQPETRLLTVVGAGGMGKTRLVLAVAQQLLVTEVGLDEVAEQAANLVNPKSKIQNPKYPDGIFFLPLAALTTAAALAPTIAEVLGLEVQGEPGKGLAHFLQKKRLLLILDNFEHLLEGAGLVATLLQQALGVQILVTSRERLKLRSEQLYPLAGLDYDQARAASSALAPAAMQFFVHYAQQHKAGFTLQDADRDAVLQICHFVQGLPLGLEMAAAWIAMLSPQEIAQEIAKSADFLSTDWQDAPVRQRSMRAVFDWSWRLLVTHEQQVLRQLALFAGSFTREAAEQIAGASLRTLTSLLNKSLLHYAHNPEETASDADQTGAPQRYELHTLVRQFAAEQLDAAQERVAVEMRYSTFYLRWLAVREAPLLGGQVSETVREIQQEFDHVQQAWGWAVAHQQWQALAPSAYALYEFLAIVGRLVEGEQLFGLAAEESARQLAKGNAVATAGQAHQQTLSKLWAFVALARVRQGKSTATEATQQAITLGEASGALDAQILGYYAGGQNAAQNNHFSEAQSCYANLRLLFEQVHRLDNPSLFLRNFEWRYYLSLLSYATSLGRYAEAQTYGATSLQLAQTLGSLRGQITARMNLIDLYLEHGAFAQIRQELDFVLPIAQQMRWRWGECGAYYIGSFVYAFYGDYHRALTAGQTALAIVQEIGDAQLEMEILTQLAYLHMLLGNSRRAGMLSPFQTPQAQQDAPIHLRYLLLIMQTLHAWQAGQAPAAYALAAEALTVANAFNNRLAQACALVYQGHIQAELQAWTAADEAYQAALHIFTEINAPAMSLEAQAGLAQLALRQGDSTTAQRWVEALLPLLTAEPCSVTTPAFTYLVCYEGLAANADPRATTLLQQGHAWLQQAAASLDDEIRPHFLEAMSSHRALVEAYRKGQVGGREQGARGREQGAEGQRTEGQRIADSGAEGREQESGGEENQTLLPAPCSLPLALRPLPLAPLLDWAEMPAVDFFTGRAVEVAQLTAWLAPSDMAPSARLISILGLGGMGKTTLAAAVTKAVAPTFAVVIWRSLLNAPPLAELLRNWLQSLARQRLTTLPATLDEQLRLLLGYLRQERCLLVLDNVESIFDPENASASAGVMRPGYEGYDQLFQRLGNSDHQSCLLLTSREQPAALAPLGRPAQETSGRIRVLPLPGLDVQAGHVLLQTNGLQATAQEAARLIDNYSGNPLALQIVATTIVDFFGGDVAAFEQEEGRLFDGLRVVLDQQFARLSPLEQEILVWLAIEREAVTVPMLRRNLVQPVTTRALLEALHALQNRSLLEKHTNGLSLQNVIIEYTTEYLVEQVCQELYALRITHYALREAAPVTWQAPMANAFLNRFALLRPQAKEYIQESQKRLLVQPLVDRLVVRLGKAQAVAHITQLLDALRRAEVRSGYAAGNLLNLLVQLEGDLTGYDFSQLAVWQADLRGVMAAALNFTGSDLTNSAFIANIDTGMVKFRRSGELLIADSNKGELCLWRTVDGQLTDAFRRAGNSRRPLSFSADGNWLAVAGGDYTVQIWSVETGACVQTLTGHNGPINALAMSEDGALLASSSADGVVGLWAWRSGQLCQWLAGSEQRIDALAFSPDGHTLASGCGDGLIHLWDAQSTAPAGRLLATLSGHRQAVGALAFSPDGRWLASGGHDGTICLWDRQSEGMPCQRLAGHTSIIRALLFQPLPPVDGRNQISPYLLASGSSDATVRLWTLNGELRYTLLGHTNEIVALTFSPDGRQLASSGADQTIYWWDTHTGQTLNSLQAYRSGPTTIVRFSPDGKLAVSGSADQRVRLWAVASDPVSDSAPPATTAICQVLPGHTNFVRSVAFSLSGQLVASGGADNTVRLWDRKTYAELQTLTGHTGHVLALAFTRTGTDRALLASAGADRLIRLWLITESQPAAVTAPRLLIGHEDEILTLAFDPTGRTLVSGSMDGSVRIWDVASGSTRLRLTGHTAAVTMVALNADGSTLATSAFDQTVRLWDLKTGACLHSKKDEHVGTRAVVFGRQPGTDEEFLAYDGDDFAIYLWPWRTGAPPAILRGHSNSVLGLDVSPTEPLLVSLSKDGTLRLWDLATHTCRQVLHAPGPYAGMNIAGVTGISAAQKAALRALGAVEK